ncbi:MAG TPA: kelch repeat-containing protein [Casimicrobiaceae bacterium]|jgi:N-acetylneuraminic acid mutarotase|nr:kelch repeat-containing protein [Casimicrobiaceae bacterium]
MTVANRWIRDLLLAGSLAFLSATIAHAEGKWVKLAPFPEPAEELLGVGAAGKMYVFCGLAPLWKPIGLVYEYDPSTDKWTKKKPMPLLSHHVAFAEYRGRIYAFGGFVPPASGPPAWAPINSAWEYDPATDAWKALAPMPTGRGAAVAAVVGDRIYVIGGATTPPGSREIAVHPARPHVSVGVVEEYDPAANTWRERSSMPTPRNHATAGAVNGKIYVIGGRVGGAFISSGSSNVDVVEEYDPATDAWGSARARMPSARSAMASGVHGGRIYVSGGEGQNAQMMYTFRALEAYDPATNSWTILPSMPTSRHGLAGGVVGNHLHMVSGDVQSAGSGVQVHSDSHDAFEFAGGTK